MNKRRLVLVIIIAMAMLFFSVGIYAGTEVDDVVKMENPAYKKRQYKTVMFTHKKHVDEYKASCGECHHDEDNKPLDLKEGDEVQNCIECHKIPDYIKGK
ncbi:MAG: cytochrome c3 family protein [Desulfobacterales bacterium]|nr:MAG: cytochrome c3 family protein [Desulfobacterales bacterium]